MEEQKNKEIAEWSYDRSNDYEISCPYCGISMEVQRDGQYKCPNCGAQIKYSDFLSNEFQMRTQIS